MKHPQKLMTWDQIISKQTYLVRQLAVKSPAELKAEVDCLRKEFHASKASWWRKAAATQVGPDTSLDETSIIIVLVAASSSIRRWCDLNLKSSIPLMNTPSDGSSRKLRVVPV